MADIQVANTDADLSGNTVVTEENASTITGLHTFSRSTNAPFACISGAAVVTYLDADKLDGQEGVYYLAAANITGTLAVNQGGTGAATFTDGGVLLGSGTSAITATAVLGDGVILIGDASGDPTTLDVGSSTAITILGTIATGVWNGTSIGTSYTDAKVTSVVAGTLVDVSGATGDVTVNVDLSELSTSTADGDGDYFAVVDTSDAQKKLTKANISIGGFNTAVSTSITGTGTIASGVWNGTAVTVPYGGTGATSLTDGGVLLGNGTGTVAAMSVLADSEMIVGDGSTDPVAESGSTLRTSIGCDSASNITSGTLANARLPTNVDLGGTLDVTGETTLDAAITVAKDTDIACYFGMGFISSTMTADRAHFGHIDCENATDYALVQTAAGATTLNSKNGQAVWFGVNAGAIGNWTSTGLRVGDATTATAKLDVNGSLSKTSGAFKIDHPLESMSDHHLIHSFVEAPMADLIYRSTVTLVDGTASIDLDEAAGMTSGTWVLLCRDEQCFTSNETGWFHVRGSVTGSTLTIDCEEATCTDTVSWMVVACRKDRHMYDTEWTDDDGYPIIEPLKVAPDPEPPM